MKQKKRKKELLYARKAGAVEHDHDINPIEKVRPDGKKLPLSHLIA